MLQSPKHIIVTVHNTPTGPATVPLNTLLATVVNSRDSLPLSENLRFFQDAVGGELVTGARYLLSGSPGGGKSRLATQICLDLGQQDIPSLTILTEEAPAQMKHRAQQMTSDWQQASIARALSNVYVDHNVFDVTSLPDFLMRHVLAPGGVYHGVKLIVLDSIQGQGLAACATKSYAKVLDFARMCEEHGITTLLLCHQTKRGDLGGPKSLEHSVDTSLILRRAMQYSLLAVRKNRYGPPLLQPMPLRFDPVTIRLEPAPHCEAKPAMAHTYAGPGTGELELQASVTIPGDGSRGRMTAPGLPRKEIEQLVSCISQMKDMDFGELNYSINCRLPGSGQYSPILGLPLCMALIGSYIQKAVPGRNIYIGEIDLFRRLRVITPSITQSLKAALDSGEIDTPVTLFLHPLSAAEFAPSESVRIVPCDTLESAVFQTWPDLR
ncbi:MAG: ATPase domain-containing protein [Phycisphaerae bacterium]